MNRLLIGYLLKIRVSEVIGVKGGFSIREIATLHIKIRFCVPRLLLGANILMVVFIDSILQTSRTMQRT